MNKDNPVETAGMVRGFALACALLTLGWLLVLGILMAGAGPLETAGDALAFVADAGTLYRLNYTLAAAITVAAMGLMSSLGWVLMRRWPLAVVIAGRFIPVYGALNLLVYLSQIHLVPVLAAGVEPGSPEAFVVVQLIQTWPSSMMALANGLAYGALAVPSICFGMGLIHSRLAPAAGGLLGFSGAFCLGGLTGMLTANAFLALGTLVGGVLFLASAVVLGMRPLSGQ